MANQKGEAYAFFNCDASYDQITSELPAIRGLVKTPSALELSLFEGVDKLTGGNPRLDEIVDKAKYSGMKYAFKASLEAATNKEVADEAAGILNQAYQSPLYQKGESFNGAVVYEEKGEYIFRE